MHALDDVEFHTRLVDDIQAAKRMLKGRNDQKQDYYKRDLSQEEGRAYLSIFMGVQPRGKEMMEVVRYQQPSAFFLAIKKYAPEKWKMAVSDLLKAVL